MAEPISFALNAGGPVEQRAAQPEAQSQVSGAAGAANSSAGSIGYEQPDKTTDILMGLGSKLLGPRIQAARQEQFMAGVQKAQTGAAITDIIKDEPAWATTFGPTAASAGARAYTAQVALAGWAGQMEAAMPKLAEQGPEAIHQMATGALKGFMTGDAEADALITSAAVEQFAPLFKRQAKEHVAYNQNKASEQQLTAWSQLAKVYQSQAGDPKATPEDKKAAGDRFLGNLGPFGDQTEASYNKNMALLMENAIAGGDFQTIRLFQNTKPDGKTSLWEQMPFDTRNALERAIPGAARKALDAQMPKYALDVAMIVNDTAQDPRKVGARITEFNAKVAAETGITEVPMIAPGSTDNITGNVLNAQAAERARRANEKIDNSLPIAQSLVGTGQLSKGVAMGLTQKADGENAVYAAFLQAKTPAAQAALLNQEVGFQSSTVRDDLTKALNAPEYNAAVSATSAVYDQLNDQAKANYFDEKQRALLDRYAVNVRAGVPGVQAWQAANLFGPEDSRNMIPEKEKAVIQKEIRKQAEKHNESWFFGANSVSDASLRVIESVMLKSYKADRMNTTPDVAAARSYQQAMNNGLSIVGNHAVLSPTTGNIAPLYSLINAGTGETATAFDDLMTEKAKAMGADLDNYMVMRQPDRGGKAYFQVLATDSSGYTKAWTIGSDDIAAKVKAGVKVKTSTSPYFPNYAEQNLPAPY